MNDNCSFEDLLMTSEDFQKCKERDLLAQVQLKSISRLLVNDMPIMIWLEHSEQRYDGEIWTHQSCLGYFNSLHRFCNDLWNQENSLVSWVVKSIEFRPKTELVKSKILEQNCSDGQYLKVILNTRNDICVDFE